MNSPFGPEKDRFFMLKALQQAKKAQVYDEVPIGAIVVDKTGTIIARAYNKVEKKHSQTAHAEILAIEKAGKKLKNWRLTDCWLYVTLEPCAMCMNLIQLSRLAGIVFGADSPIFGFRLDNNIGLRVYKNDTIQIVTGICARNAAKLLKEFFKEKRKKGEQRKKEANNT